MSTIEMNEVKQKGKLLSFEGIDGSGKSSNIEWLAATLRELGIEVVITREPGGTPLGEKLRELLLHEAMHKDTEALLMFAARKEHIEQVIKPTIDRGAWVITDRFTDSSVAYQEGGKGVSAGFMFELESNVLQGLQPDITFLFDLPVGVAHARISAERVLDRFEQEKEVFHQRVRERYLARVREAKGRIRVINAEKPIHEIRLGLLHLIHEPCFHLFPITYVNKG